MTTAKPTAALPSRSQIEALHRRHAPDEAMFDLVWTHCQIVAEVAEQLMDARPSSVDAELVVAGSLLHDIGVYRLYTSPGKDTDLQHYIRHGVLGHDLLRAAGLPEVLCRFCSHHTGVGITRHDVLSQHLPLPVADYLAETDEERLVMYADKFHSKSSPPKFLSAASYTTSIRRYGEDKAARFAAMVSRYGEPDLSQPALRHGHRLV